ncbi:DUF5320 domain-containing protein [Desulfobulbus oligotrophicus]|uniref:DUF5320 domain-containing protein n=1 Tax=Desulfobulbus oligotrophicus TaxID=1909699 RepID=A0A7T5VCP6_9BACT|nr:DUF5320 domain-containing protein [Desulfobulbus oligotrophicus]QQG65459.1 DUF5320 domain-containing protein [Desulfobulbus oligotrophicus]
MPGRDGSGPLGKGSMTGRGAGFCGGTGVLEYTPGQLRGGPGRGGGMRTGRGRGFAGGGRAFCRRSSAQRAFRGWGLGPGWGQGLGNGMASFEADAGEQRQALKLQAEHLQTRLDAVNQRLALLNQEQSAA